MKLPKLQIEKEVQQNLIYWFWFGLVISIVPLLSKLWKVIGLNSQLTFFQKISEVIANGELLIVCVALLGVNIGELVKEHTKYKGALYTLIGMSLVISLMATISFTEISINKTYDKEFIAKTSLWVFFATIVICFSSIVIPKEEQ